MFENGLLSNTTFLVICYVYVLLVIAASEKLVTLRPLSRKISRKFLHMMIGNILFLIPFFTFNSFPSNFPFFVAAPFVLVTFLATPYSPLKALRRKLSGLNEITHEGHQLGLVFYAISYTVLAFFFASRPYVIAAGILPMAYGDAAASLIGERYGKKKFHIFARKSVEGSVAMLIVSILSITVGLLYFSFFYSFTLSGFLLAGVAAALVATVAEALTPLGFDNIMVPLLSALSFFFLIGLV